MAAPSRLTCGCRRGSVSTKTASSAPSSPPRERARIPSSRHGSCGSSTIRSGRPACSSRTVILASASPPRPIAAAEWRSSSPRPSAIRPPVWSSSLAEKGVMTNTDKAALPLIHQFAADWITKLQGEDEAVRDSGTLGWRYQDDEIVGLCLRQHAVSQGRTENTDHAGDRRRILPALHCRPAAAEAWIEAARLLTARQAPELDIIIAIGFAAPLMVFAGTLYGAISVDLGPARHCEVDRPAGRCCDLGAPQADQGKPQQRRRNRCRGGWGAPAIWRPIGTTFRTNGIRTHCSRPCSWPPRAPRGEIEYGRHHEGTAGLADAAGGLQQRQFVEYLIKKQKSTTAGMRRVFEIEFDKQGNGTRDHQCHRCRQDLRGARAQLRPDRRRIRQVAGYGA